MIRRDAVFNEMLGLEPLAAAEPLTAFVERFHPDDCARMSSALDTFVVEGGFQIFEHRLLLPDNTVRWIRSRGSCATVPDSGQVIHAGVAIDITREKRLEQQRDLFLGVLGHDLRNPLNVVSMGAQAILVQDPSPTSAKVAGRILLSVERMSRLINQVIGFARAHSEGIRLGPTRMELGTLAREVAAEVEAAHPARRVSVEVGAEVVGEWDRDRLAQVLQNLLVNAVTHGDPAAPVRVKVSSDAGFATLEVENEGQPIPENLRNALFDPFERASQRTGGVGLGLYITREIVLAHGGEIGFTSDEQKTRFHVRLPRSPVRQVDNGPSTGRQAR
jgi:signal transduction histidine kinase